MPPSVREKSKDNARSLKTKRNAKANTLGDFDI